MTRHLLKPSRTQMRRKLVFPESTRQTRYKLPTSKRPYESIYHAGKATLEYYGYYEDLRKYDPGYYKDLVSQRLKWWNQSDINKYVEIQRFLDVVFPKKSYSPKTSIQSREYREFYQKLLWQSRRNPCFDKLRYHLRAIARLSRNCERRRS